MKSLLALSALLLSASPALADDFFYLQCNTNLSKITKDLRANKIIESQEGVDIPLISKVDLKNNRIMGAQSNPGWEEMEIVNGVYSVEEEELENGVTTSMSMSMQVDPPGQVTLNILSRDDDISISVKMTGMCKEVDASVFEKALKESES
tara:strand:- start:57 stop:506 length:450 start_codon:yes stop_codon:yes gene_type:complete